MATNPDVRYKIDQDLCIVCGLCREVCPTYAVHNEYNCTFHRYTISSARCTGCAICVDYCPVENCIVPAKA